jgi:gliding motility-associated-like protein
VATTNGCSATATVTLFVNTTTATAIADLTTVCPGLSTDIIATGGGTYLWSTGETTAVISVTPLAVTTYSVTVTNNGCTDVASATVSVNTVLIPTVSAAPAVVCPGESTTLTASGGTAYTWNTGATGASITVAPLVTSSYSVTVSSNGCTGSGNITVTVDANLNTTANAAPDTVCVGQSTTLTATGGGTYLWSTGQSGSAISVTPAMTTTYSVTVSNNGCTGVSPVTVVVRPLPTPVVTAAPATLCVGQSSTLTATGGDTYLWEDGQTGASITVTPAVTTTYMVIANDAGCTASASTTVLVNPLPVALADPDTICVGESAVLTASGGDIYQWSTGQTGSMITVSPLVTTTYHVTVIDEGCSATVPVTVTVNPLPMPVVTAAPPVICSGESSTLSASGGASFVWSTGASGALISVSPLSTATYAVTATENGCIGTTQITLSVSLPPFAVVAPAASVCNGPGGPFILDFSTLVTGGDQGGIWTDVQNSGASGTYPALDFTGVTPGDYLFRYTTQSAAAPCEEVAYEVNVAVVFCNCPSVATIGGGPLCNSAGTLALSTLVQTTEPGAWSIVGVPAGAFPAVIENGIFNALNADAGVYELRFTLLESPPLGCPAFSTQLIAVEAAVSAGVPGSTPQVCFGENEVFDLFELLNGESVNGQWTETSSTPSVGGAFQAGAGSFDVANQQPGIYRFRYRIDPGGVCPAAEAFVAVEIVPLPIARAGADKELDCVLTEVALDGSGSSSGANIVYLWTTTDGRILSGANSLMPLVDASGTYLLLVTDQTYGCFATDVAVVIADNTPPEAALLAVKNPLCHNQTSGSISVASVTGGSAPYLYSINRQPFTASPEFNGLSGGTYTIEIEDANGCRWETSVALINPPAISVNAGPDVTIFYGESTVLRAAVLPLGGNYTYAWTPSDNLSCNNCAQTVAAPDSTTLYEVLVTDSNGCQARDEVRVTVRIRRDVFIPNGFSPNDDGVNDRLIVFAGDGVERILEFNIHNRWGESVFYVANFPPNDPAYGWDGAFRHKPAALDVYVYYARVLYKDGTEKLFKGDVTLMR